MGGDRADREDGGGRVPGPDEAKALLAAAARRAAASPVPLPPGGALEQRSVDAIAAARLAVPLPPGWDAVEQRLVDAVAASSRAGMDQLREAAAVAGYEPSPDARPRARPTGERGAGPARAEPAPGERARNSLLRGVANVAKLRLSGTRFWDWDQLWQDAYADAVSNLMEVCRRDQVLLVADQVVPTIRALLAEAATHDGRVPADAWVAAIGAAAVRRWDRLATAYCWTIGYNAAVDAMRSYRGTARPVREPRRDEEGNFLLDAEGNPLYDEVKTIRGTESLEALVEATGETLAAGTPSPEQVLLRRELLSLVLDLIGALPDEEERRVIALDTVIREFDTLEAGLLAPTARSWLTARLTDAFLAEYDLPDHAENRVDEQIARILFPAQCATEQDLRRAADRVRTVKRWGMDHLRISADLREWRGLLRALVRAPALGDAPLELLAGYLRDIDTESGADWLPGTKPNRREDLRAPLILALLEQAPEGPIGRDGQALRPHERRLARASRPREAGTPKPGPRERRAAEQQVRDDLAAIRAQLAAVHDLASLLRGLLGRFGGLEDTDERPHRSLLTAMLQLLARAAPPAEDQRWGGPVLALLGSGDVQGPDREYAHARELGGLFGPLEATAEEAARWARGALRAARTELRRQAKDLI